VKIGLLVTGDTSVRAAHSLQAHSQVDEVVVIGPAKSKSFRVVATAEGCDFLVGSGDDAPGMAVDQGVPLIWDGEEERPGVVVWGASPSGITLALATRESDPRLVALAHPEIGEGATSRTTRFPDPVGRLGVRDVQVDGRPIAVAHSPNDFAACLIEGASRRVAVVDHGAFLSGVALAAGVACRNADAGPVWGSGLAYLEAAMEMGLVMAESD
jgi:hypothetical protein